MDDHSQKALLIQKKQELVTLKSLIKELKRKNRCRQRALNWAYALMIAGAMPALLFINDGGGPGIVSLFGSAMAVIGLVAFLTKVSSKSDRQLKEPKYKMLQLKREIIEMKGLRQFLTK